MYYDLSLLPANFLSLNHLLAALKDSPFGTVAVDFEFTDTLITPPPEVFTKLKVLALGCSKTIRRCGC
jgi:hypothetical protein